MTLTSNPRVDSESPYPKTYISILTCNRTYGQKIFILDFVVSITRLFALISLIGQKLRKTFWQQPWPSRRYLPYKIIADTQPRGTHHKRSALKEVFLLFTSPERPKSIISIVASSTQTMKTYRILKILLIFYWIGILSAYWWSWYHWVSDSISFYKR